MTNSEAAYPNSSSWSSTKTMMQLLLALGLLILSLSRSIEAVDSDPEEDGEVKWQILTKLNFSSQIRIHPHVFVLVTVPWSGETRSLMKELAHTINNKREKFGTLKLMLVYRNSDRMLADTLGATEGIKILYYHQSLSYKYQGSLRVQNILSSVHHVMSLMPEDIPLKSISTPESLKSFIESTDKSLLLLEFCGWTRRLLAKGKSNGTESEFDGILGRGFNLKTNRTFSSKGKKKQKKMESEQMSCVDDSKAVGNFWPAKFTFINGTDSQDSEITRTGGGVSCSFEEFQLFEAFLPNLTTVSREFFLPPERLRFGLIHERSLLSFLGVQETGPWLMMLYFAGCPSCSKVLKGGGDIKSALQMQASPVIELKGDGNDIEHALPANEPSVLLFIDRSSESLEIRRKSKVALDAFRELALYHRMNVQTTSTPQKSSVKTDQSSLSKFGHPKLDMSTVSREITTVKDKMSVRIVDKGKDVTIDKVASDIHGDSLRDILTYLRQHKDIKISSLAKDVGFELLSDDFSINIAEDTPAELKFFSNPVSSELPIEDTKGSGNGHPNENQTPDIAAGTDELSSSVGGELPQPEVQKTPDDSTKLLSAGVDPHYKIEIVANAADRKQEKTLPDVEPGEQQLHFPGFRGSFFFSDGELRLLQTLAPESQIPVVVLIDPISQQHYVLPEDDEVISYTSLCDFLDLFLNGSLLPFQRSESVIWGLREAPRPPFVNLDFHQVDSVPRVTANTFSELVVGNQSDLTNAGNAWKKDVLVLFSNNWCGFCQRMELILHEVHCAIKGYLRMLKDGNREDKFSLATDDMPSANFKLPLIYLMDCTLNDCSLILKSSTQRELYPSLLLFPAERKKAVAYEGDMSVSDVIDFIADHGSTSQRLFRENGILWRKASQEVGHDNLPTDLLQVASEDEQSSIKKKYHEILLKDRVQRIEVRDNQIRSQRLNDLHESTPQIVTGSVLIATERLLNINPFDGSKILIVKVNRSTGFQGLIVNNHISWDSLGELAEGLDLLKEAPLSLGGPVMIRGMPLVTLSRKFVEDHQVGALPDIYFLDQLETLNVIEGLKRGNQSISDYWFFLGYSSWGWDQLFDEIAEGSWKVSNGKVTELDWPWR